MYNKFLLRYFPFSILVMSFSPLPDSWASKNFPSCYHSIDSFNRWQYLFAIISRCHWQNFDQFSEFSEYRILTLYFIRLDVLDSSSSRFCEDAQSVSVIPHHTLRMNAQIFAPTFTFPGVDPAGLLCIKGAKLYILLFTCACVRAIHLEMVNSLTTVETRVE